VLKNILEKLKLFFKKVFGRKKKATVFFDPLELEPLKSKPRNIGDIIADQMNKERDR